MTVLSHDICLGFLFDAASEFVGYLLVFYEKGSLQQFMAKVRGLVPTGPPLQTVSDQQRHILMLDCKDLKVTTSHSNNSRTYTIKRLSKDSVVFRKFELKGLILLISSCIF